MYAYITGAIAWIEEDALIVLSSGIGLRIRVLPQLLLASSEGMSPATSSRKDGANGPPLVGPAKTKLLLVVATPVPPFAIAV